MSIIKTPNPNPPRDMRRRGDAAGAVVLEEEMARLSYVPPPFAAGSGTGAAGSTSLSLGPAPGQDGDPDWGSRLGVPVGDPGWGYRLGIPVGDPGWGRLTCCKLGVNNLLYV